MSPEKTPEPEAANAGIRYQRKGNLICITAREVDGAFLFEFLAPLATAFHPDVDRAIRVLYRRFAAPAPPPLKIV